MGSGFAQTVIVGRLGRDPEYRYVASGDGVCQFNVGVDRNWQKDGEWKSTTEWYRCVVWDRVEIKYGERAAEALRKGSLVLVVGHMQTREWRDKEGVKRYTTELVADRVTPLADYGKAGQGETPAGDARANVAAARQAFQDDLGMGGPDELPF